MDKVRLIIFISSFVTLNGSEAKFPVILVPGDGGSQVEAKLNKSDVVHYVCQKVTSDYFSLWLNLELLVPIAIDCWIDNMKLIYDNNTRTTHNAPGVDIRVPGFGNSSVVEYIDPSKISAGGYFYQIAAALASIGYVRDLSIRGAPYDFRKAPNENQPYFDNLKILIESSFTQNDNSKVVLLAHSMGALMCLEFLHRQSQGWKDKYIGAFVTLAGVWGGAVKAVKVYAMGDDLGVFLLNQNNLRTEQITCPSLAWLLPSPLFWKSNEVLIQTENKNFSLSNIKDFFGDIDYMPGWEMLQDVQKYALNFEPPGVELHCLHGVGVKTVEKMVYAKGAYPTGSPTLVMGDGDGTVNRRSLEGCLRWSQHQKQKIYYRTFQNVDHMSILINKDVLEYIKTIFNTTFVI